MKNKDYWNLRAKKNKQTIKSTTNFNLIKELRNLSVDELDFGGISADGSSAGVDFFKLGFNGEELLKTGEFDISKSKVYSYVFSKLLQFKKNL